MYVQRYRKLTHVVGVSLYSLAITKLSRAASTTALLTSCSALISRSAPFGSAVDSSAEGAGGDPDFAAIVSESNGCGGKCTPPGVRPGSTARGRNSWTKADMGVELWAARKGC